jgi:hypothetical protein
LTNQERTQPNGMTVGYLEIARLLPTRRPRSRAHPITCNARDDVGSDPFTFRRLTSKLLANGYDGVCWKGIDYWTYLTPEGTRRNALNTYVRFGNMVGGTPRALAFPGPHGAMSTIQFEQFREGIQECEAALAVRERIAALFSPPTKKYDLLYLTLKGALIREDIRQRGEPPYKYLRDLDLALCYTDGATTPAKVLPSARSLNQGKHSCPAFKPLPADRGQKYELSVTIGADPWVAGGEGLYVIDFQQTGEKCSGTFTGTYNGTKVSGKIEGEFTAAGWVETVGEPPPKSPQGQRWEAMLAEFGEAVSTRDMLRFRQMLPALYAAASEASANAARD